MDPKEKRAREEEKKRRREEYLARPPKQYEDHPKPVTRRQFLAHGLLDSMAFIAMPAIFRRVLSIPEARAEASTFLFPPEEIVFVINGTGGPGSCGMGAIVSRAADGSLMPPAALTAHGIVSTVTAGSPGIITDHGAWLYNVSPTSETEPNAFYNSLSTLLPADALAKLRILSAQTIARDDSDEGPAGTMGVLARTFVRERFAQDFLLGGGLAVSGGANMSARQYASGLAMSAPQMNVEDPRLFQSVRVGASIRNALDKPLASFDVGGNDGLLKALAKVAKNLSLSRTTAGGQARAVEFQANAETTARQATSINGNFGFLDANAILAPSTRTILNSAADNDRLLPTLSALFSGAVLPIVTYWKGGGDHHNGDFVRSTSYAAETAALIAALVNEGSIRNVKVNVLMVFDGAYYANAAGFQGDRGEQTTYSLFRWEPTPRTVLKPAAASAVGTLGHAVNGYNASGTLVGGQEAAALALFANVMDAMMGKSYRAEFERIVVRNSFDATNLPRIECFG